MEALIETNTCSICQELFVKPITTSCGHNFCRVSVTLFRYRGVISSAIGLHYDMVQLGAEVWS